MGFPVRTLAPCVVCGTPTRSAHGACDRSPECRRERDRRRYAADPQKVMAATKRNRERRQADNAEAEREKNRNRGRRRRAVSPEKVRMLRRESMRKWRAVNLEASQEHLRRLRQEWKAKDPEVTRAAVRTAERRRLRRPDRPCRYAKAGCGEFAGVGWTLCKEHKKADDARRYARRRAKLAEKLAGRQDGICTWCGGRLPADLAKVEIDHIIPKASGLIIEDDWNLQALHRACNYAKGALITTRAVALAAGHGITLEGLRSA